MYSKLRSSYHGPEIRTVIIYGYPFGKRTDLDPVLTSDCSFPLRVAKLPRYTAGLSVITVDRENTQGQSSRKSSFLFRGLEPELGGVEIEGFETSVCTVMIVP